MLLSLYVLFIFFLTFAYAFIIGRYLYGWNLLKNWSVPAEFTPKTSLSILIPARNEEDNIEHCIEAILKQNYPPELYEILVIDDHSTDQTATIVSSYNRLNVKVLSLKDCLKDQNSRTIAFKKAALELGIAEAKGNLIITTDADCIFSPNWLRHLISYYEFTGAEFIAAPVCFSQEGNLLERFQSLDFLGMMLITGAGIRLKWMYMCNGANLAYTKRIFEEVKGFEGISKLASGDDMLLMHKVAEKYSDKIGFVKNPEACVTTYAKRNWGDFMQQRLRWASKSAQYRDWQLLGVLAVVFLFCITILLHLLLIPFLGLTFLFLFLFQVSVKILADYFFLKEATEYFNRTDLMRYFFPAQFIHAAYIIAIGLWSNVQKTYTWKGRKVR